MVARAAERLEQARARSQSFATIMRVVEPGRGNSLVRIHHCSSFLARLACPAVTGWGWPQIFRQKGCCARYRTRTSRKKGTDRKILDLKIMDLVAHESWRFVARDLKAHVPVSIYTKNSSRTIVLFR